LPSAPEGGVCRLCGTSTADRQRGFIADAALASIGDDLVACSPPTCLTVIPKDRTIAVPGDVSDVYLASIAASQVSSRREQSVRDLPRWARWNGVLERRYTLGVEEEVMLLDGSDHLLSQSSEAVLARLSGDLGKHTVPETHAAVIELATLRAELTRQLRAVGLAAASAGTYPLSCPGQTRVTRGERYRMIADSMRALARREPTLALHVHVGVPDEEDAIRVLNRLRGAVPVLLALSANSPFCQGRDTGFASTRTVISRGPACGHSTTVRRLCRLRRCGGRNDRLGRVAGPELSVVGRAPTAGARHC
jgi:hypothetical protein